VKRVRTVVVLLITALVLFLVVRRLNPSALSATLQRVRPTVIVGVGVGSLLVAVPLSAEGLRWMLRAFGHGVTRRDALRATVGNLAVNSVLPAGGGQFTRVAFLHRAAGVPAGAAIASAAATLGIKLLWLLCASALAVSTLPRASVALRLGLPVAAMVLVVCGLRTASIARWMAASGWVPGRIRALAAHLCAATGDVRLGPLSVASAYALASLVSEWALFAVLLAAAGGPWLPAQTVAYFPLATIAGKLPITSMGFGTREAAVLALFDGASAEQLLTAALLFSTLGGLLPAIVGTAATWQFVRRMLGDD